MLSKSAESRTFFMRAIAASKLAKKASPIDNYAIGVNIHIEDVV